MGVYLYPSGTETELKNAYIGEVIEYEWDFTDWTNTIASLQSQWWNFNGKTVSVSSSWFYHDDGRILFSPFSLSDVKKVVCEWIFQFNTSQSNWNIWYGSLSWASYQASGNTIPSYYSNKWYSVSLLWTTYIEDVSFGTGTYHSTVTIDLENWILSNYLEWYWTKSTTITSSQISTLKQAPWIMNYAYMTYTKYLKITFSM